LHEGGPRGRRVLELLPKGELTGYGLGLLEGGGLTQLVELLPLSLDLATLVSDRGFEHRLGPGGNVSHKHVSSLDHLAQLTAEAVDRGGLVMGKGPVADRLIASRTGLGGRGFDLVQRGRPKGSHVLSQFVLDLKALRAPGGLERLHVKAGLLGDPGLVGTNGIALCSDDRFGLDPGGGGRLSGIGHALGRAGPKVLNDASGISANRRGLGTDRRSTRGGPSRRSDGRAPIPQAQANP
jgi:hypothetical protein